MPSSESLRREWKRALLVGARGLIAAVIGATAASLALAQERTALPPRTSGDAELRNRRAGHEIINITRKTGGPPLLCFRCVLPDSDGKPVAGTVKVTFFFYDNSEGGAVRWWEAQEVVVSDRGGFSALVGSTQPDGLPMELFRDGGPLYLAWQVGDQPEVARRLDLSDAYAFLYLQAFGPFRNSRATDSGSVVEYVAFPLPEQEMRARGFSDAELEYVHETIAQLTAALKELDEQAAAIWGPYLKDMPTRPSVPLTGTGMPPTPEELSIARSTRPRVSDEDEEKLLEIEKQRREAVKRTFEEMRSTLRPELRAFLDATAERKIQPNGCVEPAPPRFSRPGAPGMDPNPPQADDSQ